MSDDEPQNDDRDDRTLKQRIEDEMVTDRGNEADDSPLADLLIDEKADLADADGEADAADTETDDNTDEGHGDEIYRDDHLLIKPHPAGLAVSVGRDPGSARPSVTDADALIDALDAWLDRPTRVQAGAPNPLIDQYGALAHVRRAIRTTDNDRIADRLIEAHNEIVAIRREDSREGSPR